MGLPWKKSNWPTHTKTTPPFKIIQDVQGRKVKYKIYKHFPYLKPIPKMHDECERFYKAVNVLLKENNCGKTTLDEMHVTGDHVSYMLRIIVGSCVTRRRALCNPRIIKQLTTSTANTIEKIRAEKRTQRHIDRMKA